ncbi:MAG TPA: nucleotidyltransferase family protein [Casimicrobiaceae bacterium]|nr:nucleotidyltransferase family protein [Casimicrobiaceae bacterium]
MPAAASLLLLVRYDWDRSSWRADGDRTIDWTEVVRMALDHGVGGLLCRSIGALPPGLVPDDIAAAATIYLDRAKTEGALLLGQLTDALDALDAGDIASLPFKGPALGALAHASPTIRPSRDIDVLVHPRDMDGAIAALGRLGYRLTESLPPKAMAACYESYGQDIVFAAGRAPVEPHCAFTPSTLAVDLDLAGIWRRASPLVLDGRTVRTLSLEDTLLVACLHGSKERWWRLLWIADVAALIHRHSTIDWPVLMERARAAGAQRMLLLGVGLARELFASGLPERVAAAIDGDATLSRLVQEIAQDVSAALPPSGPPDRLSLYYWRLRERPRDRLRYVWRTLTTPRFQHYGMVRLPDALFGGYVVVKLVHDYVLLPLWWLAKGRWRRRGAASQARA